ncbi:hypothetical protein LEP1GSC052_0039 [Leptospira kmetyi serovar Malaysia str. Bejo-Iso9]|nr:hypothetical protein LEP1GSC052_0039 [Leptospira kmetyi serovar Malaysia str. Bejo-Iso9]
MALAFHSKNHNIRILNLSFSGKFQKSECVFSTRRLNCAQISVREKEGKWRKKVFEFNTKKFAKLCKTYQNK